MFYSNPCWLYSIWISTSPSVAGAASETCTNRGLPYQRWLRTASEQTPVLSNSSSVASLRTLKEARKGNSCQLIPRRRSQRDMFIWILTEILKLSDSTKKASSSRDWTFTVSWALQLLWRGKEGQAEKALTWKGEAETSLLGRYIHSHPHATTPSTKPNSPTKCVSYRPFYQKFNCLQSLPSLK